MYENSGRRVRSTNAGHISTRIPRPSASRIASGAGACTFEGGGIVVQGLGRGAQGCSSFRLEHMTGTLNWNSLGARGEKPTCYLYLSIYLVLKEEEEEGISGAVLSVFQLFQLFRRCIPTFGRVRFFRSMAFRSEWPQSSYSHTWYLFSKNRNNWNRLVKHWSLTC